MELVSATLAIPPKEAPKDKDHESTTAANTQLPKDIKEKLVIKMKKKVTPFFLFYFIFLLATHLLVLDLPYLRLLLMKLMNIFPFLCCSLYIGVNMILVLSDI